MVDGATQYPRALAEGLFTGEEFGKALSVEELTELLRGSSGNNQSSE